MRITQPRVRTVLSSVVRWFSCTMSARIVSECKMSTNRLEAQAGETCQSRRSRRSCYTVRRNPGVLGLSAVIPQNPQDETRTASFAFAEDGSNELKLVQRLIKLCPQELDHSLMIIELYAKQCPE